MFCNLCYILVVVLFLFHTHFQLCRLLTNSGIFWKSLLVIYDLRNSACKWVTIYVVQIIYTILGRMCILPDFHFTLLYVVVSISTYI